MKFKHKLGAYCLSRALSLLFKTVHLEIEGMDHYLNVIKKGSCILSFWHNQIILMPLLLGPYTKKSKVVACVSKSRDGDWLEAIIKQYPPSSSIRIAHTGRSVALMEMIKQTSREHTTLLITPDGPRGPKYSLKKGVLVVAEQASIPILTIAWDASSYWTLPTWDAFRVPKPFSKIVVKISPPLLPDSQDKDLTSSLIEGMNPYFLKKKT